MSLDYKNIDKIFNIIASSPQIIDSVCEILQKDISLPNIPFPTLGGKVFWTTICESNGYKLQQNMFTHHARILDRNSIRLAWGTLNGMKKALIEVYEFKKDSIEG